MVRRPNARRCHRRGLTATLEAPGDGVVTLLAPDSPFTLTGVSVEDADLVLIGTIDLDSLLR